VPEAPFPVEARRLPAERQLRLTWSDGHVGSYEYDRLRGWCPCAMCQGHQVLELAYHPPAARVELRQIQPVGNYGLSFVWSDGHGTGIYRFDFLRHLCPCAACLRTAGGEERGQGGLTDVDPDPGGDGWR
jgi:DUF971 family protein